MEENNDYTTITTRQAAQLIHVHESSVKRWCKEGHLPCDITEGGHRRIKLQELLSFADQRNIPCMLGAFSTNAPEIWSGLRNVQTRNNFDALFDKAYHWLRQPAPDLFNLLILFCLENGVPFCALFDAVIARALRQLGEDWQKNEIDVGTEHYVTEIMRDVLHLVRQTLNVNRKNGASVPSLKHPELIAIVGCNAGNQHDIGAQAIRILLEVKGWKTIYLGANVPVNDFASLQVRHKAHLLCISFISSSMISEAERVIDVLAKFYDTTVPYHLAIGGHLFPEEAATQIKRPSFINLDVYRSTTDFDLWLDHHLTSAT